MSATLSCWASRQRNPVLYMVASSVRCFRLAVTSSKAFISWRLHTVGSFRRTFGLAISCSNQVCFRVRV